MLMILKNDEIYNKSFQDKKNLELYQAGGYVKTVRTVYY